MPAWGETLLLSVPSGPTQLSVTVKRRNALGSRRVGRTAVDLGTLPIWHMHADERHEVTLQLNASSHVTLQLALICKE
jgi:hypothetical protein